MSEREIIEKLMENVDKRQILGASFPRTNRIFLDVEKNVLKDVVRFLKKNGFDHLSTITGLEVSGGIDLLYHLSREGVILTVRVKASFNETVVPSITDIIPGANLYEREVHELLGVDFQGHPGLTRLLLQEGWPENVYPLRKKRTAEGASNP